MTAHGPVVTPRLDARFDAVAITLRIVAIAFAALFLVAPVLIVFGAALERGFGYAIAAILDPDARAALKLTLTIAAIVVPLNLVFGLAAAWAVAKFDFAGSRLLNALIDLPLAVSPVVSGLVFVLVFGPNGWAGPAFAERGITVLFALPGLVLATLFVTFPFVARELIPVMQAQGRDAEEAAVSLGANGWQTFFRVTLPNIRWALGYGVMLCSARAMGEFGAVSVVSGHIRGKTNTLPLHVEALYNDYDHVAAFAVAALLVGLALATLLLKRIAEGRRNAGERA